MAHAKACIIAGSVVEMCIRDRLRAVRHTATTVWMQLRYMMPEDLMLPKDFSIEI